MSKKISILEIYSQLENLLSDLYPYACNTDATDEITTFGEGPVSKELVPHSPVWLS